MLSTKTKNFKTLKRVSNVIDTVSPADIAYLKGHLEIATLFGETTDHHIFLYILLNGPKNLDKLIVNNTTMKTILNKYNALYEVCRLNN